MIIMKNVNLLIFAGPSGQGKTFLVDELSKKDDRFIKLRQFTTRDMRDNETEDTYEFIDVKDVEEYQARSFGKTEIYYKEVTDYYGTMIDAIIQNSSTNNYFMVILNQRGYLNLLNETRNQAMTVEYGNNTYKLIFRFIKVYVDGNNTELRKGRSIDYVTGERISLTEYRRDAINFYNNFEKKEFVNTEDAIRIIKEE